MALEPEVVEAVKPVRPHNLGRVHPKLPRPPQRYFLKPFHIHRVLHRHLVLGARKMVPGQVEGGGPFLI
jgi:hypothetical protein